MTIPTPPYVRPNEATSPTHHNSVQLTANMSSGEHVQVVVRCKPSPDKPVWKADTHKNTLTAIADKAHFEHAFTRVLEELTRHSDLYEHVLGTKVSSVLDGDHSQMAVIAFGPSCGGKSHTVFGTAGQTRVKDEARGVIYRCGEQLLRELEQRQCVYSVAVSFLQVFQDEKVADLFDTKKRNMEVVLDPSTLLYSVPELTQQKVSSVQEILRLVEKGYLIRNATGCVRDQPKKVGFSAAMKPLPLQQYRPHCTHAVFQYTVQYQPMGTTEVHQVQVSIMDLAGKAIDELPSPSDVGIEALHSVVETLSTQGMTAAATQLFGRSSLTKLLKPCFGGNCSTLIIANLPLSSPDLDHCLQFLSKALKIKNFAKKTLISLSQSELAISNSGSSVSTYRGDQDSAQDTPPLNTAGSFTERIKLQGRKPPIPISFAQSNTPPVVKKPPAKMASRHHQPTPPSPLFVSVRARADSTKSKDDPDQSSDSLSLDSDSDSASNTPTPQAVTDGPPPPPLRGIPHFNPDSPLSSQLTSTPLIPSITARPSSGSHRGRDKKAVTPTKDTSSDSSLPSREDKGVELAATGRSEVVSRDSQDTEMERATSASPKARRELFARSESTRLQPINLDGREDVPHTARPSVPLRPQNSRPQLPAITRVIPNQFRGKMTHMHVPQPPKAQVTPSLPPQGTSSPQSAESKAIASTAQEVPSKPPLDMPSISPSQETPSTDQKTPSTDESPSPQPLSTPCPPTPDSVTDHGVESVQSVAAPEKRKDRLRRSGGSLGDISNSSSSVTISSDSEGEETRDTFNPNIQQRALFMNRQGYSAALPPVSNHRGQQLPPIDHPPSYSHRSPPLPTYTSSRPPTSSSEGDFPERGGVIDLTQQMSNEEIHVAAMEGVRASEMKTLAIQYGVDYKDHGGRTPLMYAVLGNQPKMCEVLVKLRAGLNMKDTSGLTPLLWATFLAKAEVIKILLKSGADPHCTDSGGRTAFHWAMKTPNFHCLKWLCKYANFPSLINKPDNEGLTALHWAVMTDQAFHIRHLLTTTDADVSIKDRECRPPLTYSVLNFSPACIRAILEVREEAVNMRDNKGRTALHYACAEGSADCVRTLLSFRSCDLHCTDSNGTTPLHWAAAANHPGLAQLLIRRGADRAQQDNSGKTPLDHAQERNHIECIKVLQTYGLRRPSSALSIASHVSLPTHGGAPPTFDEQGHVILRRPDRRFSLSGMSVSSLDSLPADGQAGTEEREGATERTALAIDQTPTQTEGSGAETRRWASLLCCGGRRSNVVAPM